MESKVIEKICEEIATTEETKGKVLEQDYNLIRYLIEENLEELIKEISNNIWQYRMKGDD